MKRKILAGVLSVLMMLSVLAVPAAPEASADGAKLIALTFDDGPGPYTETLLSGLESKGVVATFFMTGVNGSYGVKNYNSLLSRMVADGDQLADHTWSHNASASTLASEVSKVGDYLTSAMGGSYNYLVRIPGGANSAEIRANAGHPIIFWSVDTLDWKYRNADTVYNNIVNETKDGDVILLHDIHQTSVEGVLRAIDTLKNNGFEFVTVSELFRRRGITLQNGVVYSSAPNKGTNLPGYSAPSIYADGGTVTLAANNDGVTLRYTTDGSVPNLSSPVYSGPFTLDTDATVTAAGFDSYGTRTPVATLQITAAPSAPVISSYENGLVSLTTESGDATIHITTDGSTPTNLSAAYLVPYIPGTVNKAVATDKSGRSSQVTTFYKTEYGDLFYDVPSDKWYYSTVGTAVNQGWMVGTSPYVFSPDVKMTRAMLVQILYSMEGYPALTASGYFTDAPSGKWYAAAVDWAASQKIVGGIGNGKFNPDGTLTRQQMATILMRYAEYKGADTSARASLAGYQDASSVANYAVECMQWCVAEGIMAGLSAQTLDPTGPCTRAQCATMMTRLQEKLTGAQNAAPVVETTAEPTPEVSAGPVTDSVSDQATTESAEETAETSAEIVGE